MSYTDAPWDWRRNSRGMIEVAHIEMDADDEGRPKQFVYPVCEVADTDDEEDNARLITAAPQLLKALKIALGAFERNDCIDWNILSDAIAAAEGQVAKPDDPTVEVEP